ncbi:6806_t:CDS:1 [Ambispora leptoticha]|uniref:6806_t:CDS:1 n=1 Tax=Ambispora leptoticha TaxID=144679 RepID=A0A9N9G1H9_9GLOM|nr:6806_t:CDS:1 [Ambispora leptoticha]
MCKHHHRRCHQRNNRRNSKREDRHIIFKTIVKLIADAISGQSTTEKTQPQQKPLPKQQSSTNNRKPQVESNHLNSNTVTQTETYMMEAPPPSYQEATKPYKV